MPIFSFTLHSLLRILLCFVRIFTEISGLDKMKNRASLFLKQIFSVVSSVIKTKSLSVKSKANAMKTRLLIFGLLRNKKILLAALSHKVHALVGKEKVEDSVVGDQSKAIVVYKTMENETPQNPCCSENVDDNEEGDDDDDGYPDLTHSLFDSDPEFDDGNGSVIELVKKSRKDSSDFNLEDVIDFAADVFIERFHRQMKLEKQESFNSYKDMLERGV